MHTPLYIDTKFNENFLESFKEHISQSQKHVLESLEESVETSYEFDEDINFDEINFQISLAIAPCEGLYPLNILDDDVIFKSCPKLYGGNRIKYPPNTSISVKERS